MENDKLNFKKAKNASCALISNLFRQQCLRELHKSNSSSIIFDKTTDTPVFRRSMLLLPDAVYKITRITKQTEISKINLYYKDESNNEFKYLNSY